MRFPRATRPDKLHDAIPLLRKGTVARAQARLDLSIIFTMLSDRPPSLLHAQLAYREIREATWTFTHTPDPDNKMIPRSERKKETLSEGPNWPSRAWHYIAEWYEDAEYCCGVLGDPDGYEALSAKARNDLGSLAAQGPYEYDGQLLGRNLRIVHNGSHEIVKWREGVPVDFSYIEYKQRIYQYVYGDWIDQHKFCRGSFHEIYENCDLDAGPKTKEEFRIKYESARGLSSRAPSASLRTACGFRSSRRPTCRARRRRDCPGSRSPRPERWRGTRTAGDSPKSPDGTPRCVFALLAHTDKATVDPLNLDQWVFYVLPTAVLDGRTRSQHSITLRTLEGMAAAVCFGELRQAVERPELGQPGAHLGVRRAVERSRKSSYRVLKSLICTAVLVNVVLLDGPHAPGYQSHLHLEVVAGIPVSGAACTAKSLTFTWVGMPYLPWTQSLGADGFLAGRPSFSDA